MKTSQSGNEVTIMSTCTCTAETQTSSQSGRPVITIKTIEHLEGDYGRYTWPCAPVLADYVYTRADDIRGKRVLELGAGTAIPGIMAAKIGAEVILSDREGEGSEQLLENLKKTCDINGMSGVEVAAVSWGVFSPTVLKMEVPDVILASDCFYDSNDFEDVIATVAYFMEKNPKCKFWTAYQERSSNRTMVPLLSRWDMQCRSIPLESFQRAREYVRIEGGSEGELTRNSHTIHMWEITKQH